MPAHGACASGFHAACPQYCRFKTILKEDVAKVVPELSTLGWEEAALVRVAAA